MIQLLHVSKMLLKDFSRFTPGIRSDKWDLCVVCTLALDYLVRRNECQLHLVLLV